MTYSIFNFEDVDVEGVSHFFDNTQDKMPLANNGDDKHQPDAAFDAGAIHVHDCQEVRNCYCCDEEDH